MASYLEAGGVDMKYTSILFVLLLLFCSATGALALTAANSDEIVRILTGGQREKIILIAKKVSSSGFISEVVYDKMAEVLKKKYREAGTDKIAVDEMSWLCKALSSSGMDKYKPIVAEVATNGYSGKLRGYAQRSLRMFKEYAERNRIMADRANYNPALSQEENRLINMLQGPKIKLVRDAAKTIYRNPAVNAAVYDVAAAELLHLYDGGERSDLTIDTICWLCKAIGKSGDSKYEQILDEMITRERRREADADEGDYETDEFVSTKVIRNARLGKKLLHERPAPLSST